jgi:Flp pilus assembly CpaE family ATPase
VKVINTDICVIVKAKRLIKEVYKLEGDVEGAN